VAYRGDRQGYTPRGEKHDSTPDDARKASVLVKNESLLSIGHAVVSGDGDVTLYHGDGSVESFKAADVDRVVFWPTRLTKDGKEVAA